MASTVALAGADGVDMDYLFPTRLGLSSFTSINVDASGTFAIGTFSVGDKSYSLRYTGTGLTAIGSTDFSGNVTQIELYRTAVPATVLASVSLAAPLIVTSAVGLTPAVLFQGYDSITGGAGDDFIIGGSAGNETMLGAGGHDTFAFLIGQSLTGSIIGGGTAITNQGIQTNTPNEHNALLFQGYASNTTSASYDLRSAVIADIDTIILDGNASLTFNASQFSLNAPLLGAGIAPANLFVNTTYGGSITIIDNSNSLQVMAASSTFVGYDGVDFTAWYPSTFTIDATANTGLYAGGVSIWAPHVNATLLGGSGNDVFFVRGDTGSYVINGGGTLPIGGGSNPGYNIAYYGYLTGYAASSLTVSLHNYSGTVVKAGGGTDTLTNINTVIAGNASTTFYGGANQNVTFGGNGTSSTNIIDSSAETQGMTFGVNLGGYPSNGAKTVNGIDAWNIHRYFGGSRDDKFHDWVGGSANLIDGGGGNDTLESGGGTLRLGQWNIGPGAVARNVETIRFDAFGVALYTNELGTHTFSAVTGPYPSNILSYSATIDATPGLPESFTGALTFNVTSGSSGTVTATGLHDTFTSFQSMVGGDGNDTFNMADPSINLIRGGAGTDTLSYSTVTNALTVTIDSPIFDSITVTDAGAPIAQVGTDRQIRSIEQITTGSGNDTFSILSGGAVPGTLDGHAGIDAIVFSTGLPVTVEIDLAAVSSTRGTGSATNLPTIILDNIENATGDTWHDRLTGNSSANILNGLGGRDTLNGAAGNDSLIGDVDNDALEGAAGNDTLIGGYDNDSISGGDDNDVIIATHADGNDTITGGSGFDILDLSQVNGVVQINQLAGTITGSAGNDTLADVIEQIKGTSFDDVLSGGHGINVLDGEGGNDQFFGNNGDDLMRGGTGNDTFFFSTSDGNDTLLGGDGFDVLDYSSLAGVVQVNQLAGTTTGTANNDTLSDIFEMVIGTQFGDVLSGGHGINSLKGNGGDDQIFANNGDDYTSGGDGNDTITMGTGNDTHDFRNGEDVDTILDFTAGGTDDTITLRFYSGLGITTFAELQASGRLATVSGHAELALNGGDRIIFQNIASHALLTAADFVFA